MAIEKIITHPGSAHKDDFLACCVLLAGCEAPIFRREPEPSELESASCAVVDTGGIHDPTRLNFDHHQFPRESTPVCSLSLVLQYLNAYDSARKFCDWLETTEWIDCRGPSKTAEWLGIPPEALFRLTSPIDISMIKLFSNEQALLPHSPVWNIMRAIGTDLLNFINSMEQRMSFLREHCQFWPVSQLTELPDAQIAFLPRMNDHSDESSLGMDKFLELQKVTSSTVAVVYPDRRGQGYALSRFRDCPLLAFDKISNEPDVHFSHASGFLAKTSATSRERLLELVLLSLA